MITSINEFKQYLESHGKLANLGNISLDHDVMTNMVQATLEKERNDIRMRKQNNQMQDASTCSISGDSRRI